MQRLYNFKAVTAVDFPALKKLWCDVFGDSQIVVDNFFRETAEESNILVAFFGNEPVSVLYLLDSTIRIENRAYKAYYVYAVCTAAEHRGKGLMRELLELAYEKAARDKVSYLYLVPADGSLFELYEKNGYKTGFFYDEVELNRADFLSGDYELVQLTYDEFIKYRRSFNGVVATPCEKMFNSFYSPVGDEVKVICVQGEGYCVAELCDGRYIVRELFGNETSVLSCAFAELNCERLFLKRPTISGGKPYAMYKAIDGAPDIKAGFFGIPYGG